MKRFIVGFFIVSAVFSGAPAFAAVDCTKDTWVDQAGDWFATRGKNGLEKDKVLATRKADRIAKCTKRQAEQAAKEAKKAGEDMKKKLGF